MDYNTTQRNATQQIQHNSDTTDHNNAAHRNKTDTTQWIATMQHNIIDYNTTQHNRHNTTELTSTQQKRK